MIQSALVALFVGLIVRGVKGFTRGGLAFSNTTMNERPRGRPTIDKRQRTMLN
jgi:hypothetical protein